MILIISFSLVYYIGFIAGLWGCYRKMGLGGWEVLIPIYNIYLLFEQLYGDGAKMFLLLIPGYNLYIGIRLLIDTADSFGQNEVFVIGLIFLAPIFWCVLGYGDAVYRGQNADTATESQSQLRPQTAAAPGTLLVRGVSGQRSGQVFQLNGGLSFGRDPGCSVFLQGDGARRISRRHCQIFWRNGEAMLMDCGSSNGTYVEGRGRLAPNAPIFLRGGDVFYLGDLKNSFIIELI